jgi:hypothetical protein
MGLTTFWLSLQASSYRALKNMSLANSGQVQAESGVTSTDMLKAQK